MTKESNNLSTVVKKEMNVQKRRIPMAQHFLKGQEAKKYTAHLNQQIYFYKFFETRFKIKRGEIYLANFPLEYGSELHGNHFVVAILDSSELNPLVLVVPLKSDKEKEINPASDIRLGYIEGINNGKKTIAVINQVRAIDKRRLFTNESIDVLFGKNDHNAIKDYEIICGQKTFIYRLNKEQYNLIHRKLIGYITYNYLTHDDELLVDF